MGPARTREEVSALRRSSRWDRAREATLDRDDGRCRAIIDGRTCGRQKGDRNRHGCRTWVEVHHIVPMSIGGDPYDLRNLVTVCKEHHAAVEHGLLEIDLPFVPAYWGDSDDADHWRAYEAAKRTRAA